MKLIKKMTRWLNRQARLRQSVRELSSLSDRDLADIGIHRSNIYDVVRSRI